MAQAAQRVTVTAMADSAWRHPAGLELSLILRCTLDAFFDTGYHGTSMRDIARHAEMTVPALYYHHENKEALLVELLDRSINRVTELCCEALADAGDNAEARFCNLIECLVLFMTMSTKTAYLDHEVRSLSPDNRRRYAAKRRRIELMVVDAIVGGVEEGIFDVTDPRGTGRALVGMIQSIASWFHPAGPQSPQDLARAYLDVAVHAVGAKRIVIDRVRALPDNQR